MTGIIYATKSFDIGEFPFSLKTQIVWNQMGSQNFFNGQKNDFQNSFTKYQLDLNSYSKKILNISFSSFFQRNNLNSSLNPNTTTINQYQYLVSPMFQVNSKINFSFSYQQSFFQNTNQIVSFNFLHIKVNYRFIKRMILKLEGYNILDTNTINALTLTPIYTQNFERQILGRTLLIGLNYNV